MLSGPGRRQQGAGAPGGEKAKSSKLLDQFGRNLTRLASEGKLDPVVGRQTEIERVMNTPVGIISVISTIATPESTMQARYSRCISLR